MGNVCGVPVCAYMYAFAILRRALVCMHMCCLRLLAAQIKGYLKVKVNLICIFILFKYKATKMPLMKYFKIYVHFSQAAVDVVKCLSACVCSVLFALCC